MSTCGSINQLQTTDLPRPPRTFTLSLAVDFVTLAVAIFAGCRLYCSLSKASHTLAAVLYAVGFVAGVIQAGYW